MARVVSEYAIYIAAMCGLDFLIWMIYRMVEGRTPSTWGFRRYVGYPWRSLLFRSAVIGMGVALGLLAAGLFFHYELLHTTHNVYADAIGAFAAVFSMTIIGSLIFEIVDMRIAGEVVGCLSAISLGPVTAGLVVGFFGR